MSDKMFTELTISVQGKKGAGKTEMGEVIASAVRAIGGEVAKVNDAKAGVFIQVALPQGVLAPAPHPKVYGHAAVMLAGGNMPPLGEDVELRDGVIRAKPSSHDVSATEVAAPALPFKVTDALILRVTALLRERQKAVQLLKLPADALTSFGSATYVDQATIDNLMVEGALAEIQRVDTALTEIRVQYVEGKA